VQAAKGPVSAWLLPAGWFRNAGNCADGYLQCWRCDWKRQEEAQACSLRLRKQGVGAETRNRWHQLANGGLGGTLSSRKVESKDSYDPEST
jgi:hypothetical protein